MTDQPSFNVTLRLLKGYKFEIDFGNAGNIFSDEPAPLGNGDGPNPENLLAAAVANCLAASLLFALRKYNNDPGQIHAEVQGELERQSGRLRIAKLQVSLQLGNEVISTAILDKVLSQFENFCVVTQSVRSGIDIGVTVQDHAGELLHVS
ncbi:MAG: OsmC family protein [Gammaproteobacteria bacterium]|jgi:organic hydroperoxide reductase OsmC/OhrA|nr:OsmC family protein [Gammaproteobacteria bacterium]